MTSLDSIQSSVADLIRRSQVSRAGNSSHPLSDEHKKAVSDALSLTSSPTVRTFSLNKRRVRHHCHNVTVEQTDITIEGHARDKWRSFCIEGSIDKIQKVLSREIQLQGHWEGVKKVTLKEYLVQLAGVEWACGYPQFILNLM
jgi:hypothetical protein